MYEGTQNLPVIWIVWGVVVTQFFHQMGHPVMLPADQDISVALVLPDSLLDAPGVVAVAVGVDVEAEVGGQALHGVVWSCSLAILSEIVSHLSFV